MALLFGGVFTASIEFCGKSVAVWTDLSQPLSHTSTVQPKVSHVVLSVIDEAAVAASVSVDQIPKNKMMPSTPLTTPEAPPTGATLPSTAVESVPSSTPAPSSEPVKAAPAPSAVVSPPRPAPASTSDVDIDLGDLPLPAIAGGFLAAFAAGTFAMRQRGDEEDDVASVSTSSSSAGSGSAGDDVSIPYDAAARLAYDEWRATHNKGAFDAGKYAKFKAKYEEITSANMSAKKKARDTKTTPKLQAIPASADS